MGDVRHTIVTTFGYDNGAPPKADHLFDVRDVESHDLAGREARADEIAEQILNPNVPPHVGDDIGIGCDHGDDRSVHIARMVQKHVPNMQVVDRDLMRDPDSEIMGPESEHAMKLLKGDDPGIVRENMRTLKKRGMTELQAARHTMKGGKKGKKKGFKPFPKKMTVKQASNTEEQEGKED
jgi:hypothetical protein